MRSYFKQTAGTTTSPETAATAKLVDVELYVHALHKVTRHATCQPSPEAVGSTSDTPAKPATVWMMLAVVSKK